ncbi:MAG: hypothetical protein QM756_45995 [Polyangiaceae bacterium]
MAKSCMGRVGVLGLVLALGCGGKSDADSKGGGGATTASGSSSSTAAGGTTPAMGSAGGATSFGGTPPSAGGGGLPSNPSTVVTGVPAKTSQLDLLLMIDNSLTMADKQQVLASSLPALLERLVTPNCVDAQGVATGKVSPSGTCATGAPEFLTVNDLHIAVVTSSLGAHGGQTCTDVNGDDHGQLLPKVRVDPMYPVTTWNDSGFLAWDPASKASPPGDSNLITFTENLKNMVLSAGQSGCGFESQLESWYRFLIDPDPPVSVPTVTDLNVTRPEFVAAASNPILQQRAQFLRPNSVVLILDAHGRERLLHHRCWPRLVDRNAKSEQPVLPYAALHERVR